jgi:nucleoside-diphosphate-sugar epimerase
VKSASTAPKVVLTGAAGVLGSALLRELLEEDVLCLTHATPLAHTQAAQLPCDLAKPRLGLSQAKFREVASWADCIVHCAAITDYAAGEGTIRAINVQGTKHVLDLASKADAALYHVSTVLVGIDQQQREAGAVLQTGRSSMSIMAYEHSKAASDELVRTSGLPASIVRPSLILGDSSTGYIARFQGFHAMARFFFDRSIPILPLRAEALVDLLPVDVMAKALSALVCAGELPAECWLSAGERALTVEQIVRAITDYAIESGREIALPRLVSPEIVDRLIRPVFMREFPRRTQRRFEYMIDVIAPLVNNLRFPSSMPAIAAGHGVPWKEIDLTDCVKTSLAYWDRERLAMERRANDATASAR